VNSQATPTGVQLVFNAPINPNTVGFYGQAGGTYGLADPPFNIVSAAVAANGKVTITLPANTNIPAAYTAGQRVFLSGVTADTRFFGVAVVDSTAGSGTATPTVTLQAMPNGHAAPAVGTYTPGGKIGLVVNGSWETTPDGRTMFVSTGSWTGGNTPLAGILPADDYRFAVDGTDSFAIQDTNGHSLNNGAEYDLDFTVTASNTPVVNAAYFARGYGQAVNVPATGTGLPVSITNPA